MSEENPEPEVTEEPEPEPEMSVLTRTAYEAIQGGWGKGAYRRKMLIDAGHNPYDVEEEIDRIQAEKENK